jgi:beta-glucanase (GH16 family)
MRTRALLLTAVAVGLGCTTEGARNVTPTKQTSEQIVWQDLKPDAATGAVNRVTDAFPLSDQNNKGKWRKYDAMSDEFEGNALDAAKWWPSNPDWNGRQPGFFHAGNVAVSDGKLHLTMRKQEVPEMPKGEGYHAYTCAAVQSKTTVRYGYFEVKARAMKSAGSSSFWFYRSEPTWWTEIDVFEIGGGATGFERKLNMNVHVFRTPTENKHWSQGGMFLAPSNLADDYHVYGLEWGEKEIKYYFDGVLVRSGPNTHWHQPLTLNFDSETMPDWFGLPKDEDLPSTFSVEYVRAWKKR